MASIIKGYRIRKELKKRLKQVKKDLAVYNKRIDRRIAKDLSYMDYLPQWRGIVAEMKMLERKLK